MGFLPVGARRPRCSDAAHRRRRGIRLAGAALVAAAAVCSSAAAVGAHHPARPAGSRGRDGQPAAATRALRVVGRVAGHGIRSTSARCLRPAPSSPSGYAAALAALPAAQWGAADLSVSAPMPDGRTVWLYADTLTGPDSARLTGFVHSSAVVQDGGCLRVSRGGAQLLPDDTRSRIWWPSSGIALDDGHLLVAATEQQLTGTCAFCFRQVGQRGAVLDVSSSGDVVFDHWLPRWPAWTGRVTWGVGLARHAATVVLYGVSATGVTRDLYAATATVADAARGSFQLGAGPVAHDIDPAGVSGWHDASGWHLITLRSTDLVRLDGAGPAGPFTERTVGTIPAPAPGQLRYQAAAHPEETLPDGALLVTVCSNWVDGRTHPVAAYRPIYLAVPR